MIVTAWALTTGETGMRTQARGLAAAVADIVVEKTVTRRFPWPWTAGAAGLTADGLVPPWPDLVVSCGRRSVGRAIAIRQASAGRTLIVHVQDPRGRAEAFDLVVAMDHDRIAAGGRVMKVATALHDLTPANLAEAAGRWSGRLGALGRPLVGVFIGGDLRGRPFTTRDGETLLLALRRLRASLGAALAITPSRRTPAEFRRILADAFAGDPGVFLWHLEGDNPYRGILALADRLVVTSDSVSMVSEALSTGHPVEVFDLGFARHQGFIQGLVDRGLIRRFHGDPTPPPSPGAVDATQAAAVAVRRLLQARMGVAG